MLQFIAAPVQFFPAPGVFGVFSPIVGSYNEFFKSSWMDLYDGLSSLHQQNYSIRPSSSLTNLLFSYQPPWHAPTLSLLHVPFPIVWDKFVM